LIILFLSSAVFWIVKIVYLDLKCNCLRSSTMLRAPVMLFQFSHSELSIYMYQLSSSICIWSIYFSVDPIFRNCIYVGHSCFWNTFGLILLICLLASCRGLLCRWKRCTLLVMLSFHKIGPRMITADLLSSSFLFVSLPVVR
jgi:hypothetical protein